MYKEFFKPMLAGGAMVIGALSAAYGLEELVESPDLLNDRRAQLEGGSTLFSGVMTMILAPYWAFKK